MLSRGFVKIIFVLFFAFQFQHALAWQNPGFTNGFNFWAITTPPSASVTGAAAVNLLPMASVVVPGPATLTNGNLNQVQGANANAAELFSGAGDQNHADWVQISQTDNATISAATPFLSFWFAAVLNGYHYTQSSGAVTAYGDDTYVLVNVLVNGTPIYTQRYSWFDNFSALTNDGVTLYTYAPNPAGSNPVIYGYGPYMHLPWTQYYYDLSAYVGQTATIQYTAFDCSGSAHYCYGYFDNPQWVPTSAVGISYTPLSTDTPVPTNTFTNTPTITPTPTNTATVTATFTPTNSPTPTPTYTPTCVAHVWPDPYNPIKAVGGTLRFSCMNDQTSVFIYTVSGELVQTLNMNNTISPCDNGDVWGTNYCWNGRNKMGFPVASGIYLYVVQQGTQVVMRGKFLLMNTN